jgi:choline dehydrogenase-like flavoprotein
VSTRTFKTSETVDFVIVGSGAAGGVMARELSTAGFTVVVLEQGPRMNAGDFEHDELKYSFLNGITNSPTLNPQTFRRSESEKAKQPGGGSRNPLTCRTTPRWNGTSASRGSPTEHRSTPGGRSLFPCRRCP